MILGGINFALMYRAIVRRQPRAAARDEEFRLYFVLLALGALVVVTEIWTENVLPGGESFRDGVFTAVSTMTTTGAPPIESRRCAVIGCTLEPRILRPICTECAARAAATLMWLN